jgi:hypothetical protein
VIKLLLPEYSSPTIGGDFNEDIINASNNQRSRYILDFMEENNFTTVDVGKTFINSSGSNCSSIDYSLL